MHEGLLSMKSVPRPPRSAQPALKAAQKVASHSAQEVRLIGGRWKRTPLSVPVVAGLRPTPSRVRETLFNWLGQDMGGWRVLDAFAGSGALGLEAASRGAASVRLLEREPQLVKALQAVKSRLQADQVQISQADALGWMRQHAGSEAFDLVFLDPPFDDGLFLPALSAAAACVPEGGWIYLEAPQAYVEAEAEAQPEVPGMRLHRSGRAGAVHFHLFQRVDDGPGISMATQGD